MSNPPVPFQLRLLRGDPGRRKMRPEPEPTREPECPAPPSFLSKYGCDEWWRVSPELHRLGLLTLVDVACLAAYCDSYGRWRTASEVIAKMAENDETTHALLIKTAAGHACRNPLIKVVRDAASDMIRYAGEFGMTPVARSRLAGGIWNQPPGGGKFDGLLA